MALIKCPGCATDVSDAAPAGCSCRRPIATEPLAVLVLLLLLASLVPGYGRTIKYTESMVDQWMCSETFCPGMVDVNTQRFSASALWTEAEFYVPNISDFRENTFCEFRVGFDHFGGFLFNDPTYVVGKRSARIPIQYGDVIGGYILLSWTEKKFKVQVRAKRDASRNLAFEYRDCECAEFEGEARVEMRFGNSGEYFSTEDQMRFQGTSRVASRFVQGEPIPQEFHTVRLRGRVHETAQNTGTQKK
jgi:hypothetical protein